MSTNAGTAYIDVEERLDKLGSNLDRQGPGIFAGWGRKMGIAAGVAIAAGVGVAAAGIKLGGEFLGLGTQLDVLRKKAATVFEGDNAAVTSWAKANASAFGLTDDKLTGLAANFGDLLKPMGFTSKEAADMSTKVVGLSGALSAWSGGTRSAAEVSETLAKAMLGERDELKGLGIAISEADVSQRLLEKGQKDLTGTARQQAEAIATQELIFEKSADAQKAWADGSMDAVKKQNVLKEKISELKEDIADKLRPAFAAAAGIIVDKFIPGVERAGAVVGPIAKQVSTFISNAFSPGRADTTWLDNLVGGVRALIGAFKNAGDGITSSGFAGKMEQLGIVGRGVVDFVRDHFKPILIGLGATFLALTSPVTAIVAAIVIAYTRFQGFRDVVDLVVKTVLQQLGNLVAWFKTVWPQIQEAVGHVVAAVQAIWRTFGDEIVSVAHAMWNQVRNVVQTAVDLVRGVITTVLALINGDWGKAWDGLKGILSTAWEFIRETIVNYLVVVREVLEAGLDVVRGAWTRAWGGIKDVLASIWDAIVRVARDGVAKVVDVFLAMAGHIIHAADSAFGWIPGIGDKLHSARKEFDSFRNGVNATLRGIEDKTVTVRVNHVDNYATTYGAGLTGGDNADGLPKFARGFEMGPVDGPLGKPRLVVAHGGEWIGTPEQMDDLASGHSGGSLPAAGIDYDRLAEALGRVLTARPMLAVVDPRQASEALYDHHVSGR